MNALTTDTDVDSYLTAALTDSSKTVDYDALDEYFSQRAFAIEPLQADTVTTCLNVFIEETSAKQLGTHETVLCWVPVENEQLHALTDALHNWGYEIARIERVNSTSGPTSAVRVRAEQSPNTLGQVRVLAQHVETLTDALLAVVILTEHGTQPPVAAAELADEWGSVFDLSHETLSDRFSKLATMLVDDGAIPGTQAWVRETDGVASSHG